MVNLNTKLWDYGDPCLYRGVNRGNIFGVHSVPVVKDSLQETVLLLLPGAQCMLPAEYIN